MKQHQFLLEYLSKFYVIKSHYYKIDDLKISSFFWLKGFDKKVFFYFYPIRKYNWIIDNKFLLIYPISLYINSEALNLQYQRELKLEKILNG